MDTKAKRQKEHNILGKCKVVIGDWIADFQLVTYLLLVSVLLPNLYLLHSFTVYY